MALARLLLRAIEKMLKEKHTAGYILRRICDMLRAYIGKV